MVKVLFVISNLNHQGPINQLFYLCKYIDKGIIEPLIVTTSQKSFENSLHNQFSEIGIQIIDLKLSRIQSIFKATKEIQSIIGTYKIDIIQSFGFRSDIISSKLNRVYKITTVRNTLLFNWKMIWGPFLGSIFGNINLHFIKKFDSIVACSYSVHNYLKTIKVNSDVIVNSIDTKSIRNKPSNQEIIRIRKLLLLPVNEIIFITVSSKLKGKNIEFLIHAFQEKALSKHYLVIAGFVEPPILKKYDNMKNIIFVGKVNNLENYFQTSDFFVSASLHEGMPNAVIESMALGTPVILSDIPSHVEILTSSEQKIGIIFNNNDSNNLVMQIQNILKEDYSVLSANCQRTISINFNAKSMAEKYERYYSNLVN